MRGLRARHRLQAENERSPTCRLAYSRSCRGRFLVGQKLKRPQPPGWGIHRNSAHPKSFWLSQPRRFGRGWVLFPTSNYCELVDPTHLSDPLIRSIPHDASHEAAETVLLEFYTT